MLDDLVANKLAAAPNPFLHACIQKGMVHHEQLRREFSSCMIVRITAD